MNINGFENLKDLSQTIEDNTQGEMSTHLGNNVNTPIDNGLGMYNNAVNELFTYGDYKVSVNESVEYKYDINQINSNIDRIDKVLATQLKNINATTSKSDDVKQNPHIDSVLGIDGDKGEELKTVMSESHKPIELTTEIKIKDKNKFLNVLTSIFKDLPEDELKSLISGISAFVSEYDITGVRELINEVKTKAGNSK